MNSEEFWVPSIGQATQTAPWLLATVSHLQGCVETATVNDLLAANKLVRLQRRFADRGLTYESDLCQPIIVTYTDASWATRRDLSSQGGQLTVLMEQKVLQGQRGKFSVLSWTSRRLRRVARSSTSAEHWQLRARFHCSKLSFCQCST